MTSRLLFRLPLLLSIFGFAGTSVSGPSQPPNTILFLCPHGGAKSVIAASYFNQLAKESGLALTGIAAATEESYDRVPPSVAAVLARQGIDVSKYRPRRVESEDLMHALRIVAIDCDLSHTDTGSLLAERWDDVPKVSEDLLGAAHAIRRHVHELIQEMVASQSSRYSWAEDVGAPKDASRLHTCIPP